MIDIVIKGCYVLLVIQLIAVIFTVFTTPTNTTSLYKYKDDNEEDG